MKFDAVNINRVVKEISDNLFKYFCRPIKFKFGFNFDFLQNFEEANINTAGNLMYIPN